MKNCILCGKQTNGSVGVSGIKWSMLCQDCKDKEDAKLEQRLKDVHISLFGKECPACKKIHIDVRLKDTYEGYTNLCNDCYRDLESELNSKYEVV